MRSVKVLAAALALGVAACGSDEPGGEAAQSSSEGKTLKIYSSVPLQGASRTQAEAIVDGATLALEQAGGKAGPHTIEYESLDDSTAQAGAWTPEAESANALKAAQDDATAVYLGTLNSGAAKVSIPILNEAGIPMISPANTYVGLTSDEPGSEPGEPGKYYPTGARTYARVAPLDVKQGSALVTLMKEDGCTKVAMTNDKEVYGAGLARVIEMAAKAQGLTLTANDAIDKNASNYRGLATRAKSDGADCYVYSGITANNAVQQFKDFAAALGLDGKLYGPDGICDGLFASEEEGGIPASLAPQFKCTVPTLSPDAYPPAGQEFFKTYKAKFGKTADPYAIYGYEAMSLALDAIERSKTGERADILEAIFATKNRESVLGTYSINENGDTSLADYGAYTVQDGALKFDQTVKPAAS
ncbi:branched-chain amino acid ABC transporter substrate-binding protein [Solirubrobacter sp. CPCC 204708]|uniref:Branched-chain amino acid ABC transporter substrate-binding protein n=1 Tax=Solirubrobacter deserti TaxID=2282478 RepID=A0ABT4RD79_9ACTN|nr:branched-chain amino acid ABC transporter substrate-binding protein [Solirubrobacter deserti]MBE2317729.1 branched-chain amino acid ABC transporter substrate-binding protein [Solirubrobacter deserti]MDA0136494.1 branched-chain amino acid ABC transporter substrate-binding protein [Solirubrobacter deserti]